MQLLNNHLMDLLLLLHMQLLCSSVIQLVSVENLYEILFASLVSALHTNQNVEQKLNKIEYF